MYKVFEQNQMAYPPKIKFNANKSIKKSFLDKQKSWIDNLAIGDLVCYEGGFSYLDVYYVCRVTEITDLHIHVTEIDDENQIAFDKNGIFKMCGITIYLEQYTNEIKFRILKYYIIMCLYAEFDSKFIRNGIQWDKYTLDDMIKLYESLKNLRKCKIYANEFKTDFGRNHLDSIEKLFC